MAAKPVRGGKCGELDACRDKGGRFRRTPKGGKKKSAKKGVKLQSGAPKKYNCATKPRKINGRCKCKAKTGAKPFVPAQYCAR